MAVMVSRRIRMNMDEQVHISLVGLRRAPKHTHVKCCDYPMIVNLVWFLTIRKKVVLGWFPYWPSVSSDVVVMLLQFSQISLDFGGSPSFGCPPSRLRDFTRSEQGCWAGSRQQSWKLASHSQNPKHDFWVMLLLVPFLLIARGILCYLCAEQRRGRQHLQRTKATSYPGGIHGLWTHNLAHCVYSRIHISAYRHICMCSKYIYMYIYRM